MASSIHALESPPRHRRMPIGAEVTSAGVEFRVWSPRRGRVTVHIEDASGADLLVQALEREDDGYFRGVVDGAHAGTLYRFSLDDEAERRPDPASRFQPAGPHGPSRVVDPSAYRWRDDTWRGTAIEDAVIQELHVGSFTPGGTWSEAATRLSDLADVGITVLEIMPIGDFPGRFGWGYDGVNLFAPTRLYGEPDDLRRFIDAAHGHGLAVVLDVVYNHVGPSGNHLAEFAEAYFSATRDTEWGRAINFDGSDSAPVREFFLTNAGYWVDEFHFDGLRVDATQSIHDESRPHILTEIAERVRAAAGSRSTLMIAENEPQDTRILRSVTTGGHGFDAMWNDDFHHTAIVSLTGRDEAYYSDYGGSPQELLSAAKRGFLYQGQRYAWQGNRRGTPTGGIAAPRFVHYLENHDQVANSMDGRRLCDLTSPGRLRAMTALLLLGPQTPMLFQGQEYGASTPFCFFADHAGELAVLVREGRADFLAQFPSIAQAEVRARIPRPDDPATFARSRLDPEERASGGHLLGLHRDLLLLRRDDPVIRLRGSRGIDGAVLGENAFALRMAGREDDDRLLVVNLGAALHLARVPEPLLAPPMRCGWEVAWSSSDPRYGGLGTAPPEDADGRWNLPAEAAVLLRSAPVDADA